MVTSARADEEGAARVAGKHEQCLSLVAVNVEPPPVNQTTGSCQSNHHLSIKHS